MRDALYPLVQYCLKADLRITPQSRGRPHLTVRKPSFTHSGNIAARAAPLCVESLRDTTVALKGGVAPKAECSPARKGEKATAWKDLNDSFAWQSSPGRITLCLEQLEPVRRNCILHAYVDGFSHREIAERLNAPLGTIKAWIKRSLAALRECMT